MKGKMHLVGVGGIGMSGLAAMALDMGYTVSGSDRGAANPENKRIFDALVKSGLELYPQDGSFAKSGEKADLLVYSTAIEEDNPDFAAAREIPRLHRSQLLGKLLGELPESTVKIAVTGSCGKSTVTGYAAETLVKMGCDAGCLDGALVKSFISGARAGNYRAGRGYFVFEADESDKSLLNYGCDYALILNLGTDHYSKDELVRVFGAFLKNVRRGAVVELEVYRELAAAGLLPEKLPLRVFGEAGAAEVTDALAEYALEETSDGRRPVAVYADGRKIALPLPGKHMALNALAVGALLGMLGAGGEKLFSALSDFGGVWRRNDRAGRLGGAGALVYDDYAHNPEKIRANLDLMRSLVPGKVVAVFQPHGYGPFGFMEEKLFEYLESDQRPGDVFILLEPYYAGGTSSFRPHAEEVCAKWKAASRHPERYLTLPDRDAVRKFLLEHTGSSDAVAIMGARDNTLSDYAVELTR
jgi:UDP-N-acetylmuramate--alanine ligase